MPDLDINKQNNDVKQENDQEESLAQSLPLN